MKSALPFYANILLKLSLTQSILSTTFTSWIQCLWGGVPCCQHIPPSVPEVLHHSFQRVERNCCHFFPHVLFQIHRCPWFLFVHLALELSSEEEVLRLGTLVPMNIEVPTKYPLSQDRIVVFEIHLHSKSPMLYRPALHGNWNALSLARRALKDKFPMPTVPFTTVLQNRQVFLPDPIHECQITFCEIVCSLQLLSITAMWHKQQTNLHPIQRFHSQLFCKIVRYFCRTLYMNVRYHFVKLCAPYSFFQSQQCDIHNRQTCILCNFTPINIIIYLLPVHASNVQLIWPVCR